MLSTSFEFRRLVSQNSKVLLKATLTLANGESVELAGDDFMMGSATFSDAVSSDGSFDVGAAIMGQFSVSLNNYDQRFSDYDFTDSTIVPYVGVELSNESVEWLLKGHFAVEQPRSYGNTIGLTALDNMRLLEKPYAEVTTVYPATLQTIVRDICAACGITLASSAFANGSYVVESRPDDDALTCLEVVAYAAQASGNFAKCDNGGRLVVDWYDTAAFESEDWLDGDRFDEASPYASGDTADGGDFDDYGSGYVADGGDFDTTRFAIIHAISSSTIATDDVVVTGIRVTAQNEVSADGTQGQDGETSLYGSEGYVLDIGGNPLILFGQASAVAAIVGPRVVGMRFRPFDLSAIGDPALEAGDPAIITDRLQNQYRTYITSLTYKVGNYEAFSCAAETPSRNSATSFSALTKAIVSARNAVKQEKTAREAAVAELARELSESSGLFMTEEEQQDHSIVYYMHDKPTLAESQIVWKLTANALGISTDGGTSYPYGLDVSGNAILNRIYAIGIDASYIDSGRLSVTDGALTVLSADADTGVVILRDASGNYWNMHTGELRMAATSSIGGTSAQDILDGFNESITSVDVEYAQNQSSSTPPTSGWSTNAPTWQAGYYIWQRTKTISAGGTSYSDPVCISGRDGATGTNAATIYLYQRADNAPAKPSSSMTYTFSTGTLSGALGNWSRGIPSGTDTCWVIVASAISNSDTDTISASEWSDPIALSTGGIDGLNQATIYLHQRAKGWKQNGRALVAPSSSMSVSGAVATLSGSVSGTVFEFESEAPAKPASALTYTFASGVLSGNLGNWSRGVPDGDDPVWVTLATAISAEATDSIAASEWSDPVKLAEDGEGSSVVNVAYAIGTSGTEPPLDGWQSSVPNVGKGFWLWAKTEFNDGIESLTCSYMGTDGEDGNSVAIQSVTKEMGVTTVVLSNTDGTTETLTIADGEDGPNGTPGASGYVHVAWATSADGSQGFSTSVSANKTYIGVYTDHTAADSEDYRDYSWSKIKGETGTGVSAVVEQYYLSTSNTTRAGGSWSTTQPAWQQGRYIWTRSAVTWTDATTTYTAPVLAKAINGANESAQEAKAAVSDLDESLNQQAIFNRLTNNGQTQGIYLENGKVYINGTYIKSGTIDANLIKAGALTVEKNGTTVFSANITTGEVSISGDCITLGSEALTTAIDAVRALYGICSTSAATAAKAVTCSGFVLRTGACVTVKFTYANSAASPTLNVNSTGAKGIRLNGLVLPESAYWAAGQTVSFVYDGTYWAVTDGSTVAQTVQNKSDIASLNVTAEGLTSNVQSHTTTLNQLKASYGTCSTSAATAAKVVTCANFALYAGATISVKFTYANSAASPTLNVNSTGAKSIYVNGSVMGEGNWWAAGDIVTFVYSGSYWYVVDGSALTKIASTKSDVANLVLRADTFDVSIAGIRATYGTCTTAGATQTKTVTISGFQKYVGQTVTVKFTYANTATSPILNVKNSDGTVVASGNIVVNDSYMSSKHYWGAQGVMTFVWDGTYWRVGDGQTMSRIQALADSITLSVTNASLGNTASITLSANGQEISRNIDLRGVRNAFKNDTTAITISSGTVTFNSNTFVVNSTNFSVTSSGVITATSGTIGGFTIGSSSLYKTKSSLTSNTSGVYVGTDGISVGSGTTYTAIAGGYLRGGVSSSQITGYVGFNNYWTDTGVYGTRLAGRGCICLLTNGKFGIGSYYDFGTDATITVGQTKSITYVSSVNSSPSVTVNLSVSSTEFNDTLYFPTQMNSDGTAQTWHYAYIGKIVTGVSVSSVSVGSINYTTRTIQFTKGLMTTS